MQKYIGTKIIMAKPMTRQAYNTYRGWQLPADEDGADEGFLVEYVDGGKANDARHEGHISWSPADVFARTYKPLQGDGLPPYQQRVVQEKHDLDEKLEKLKAFIATDAFFQLPTAECLRLCNQVRFMDRYSSVLEERIAAFGERE
jgi:hypothetical protein